MDDLPPTDSLQVPANVNSNRPQSTKAAISKGIKQGFDFFKKRKHERNASKTSQAYNTMQSN